MIWTQQIKTGLTQPMTVRFTILADGSSTTCRSLQPSGVYLLEYGGARARSSTAAPFSPLPRTMEPTDSRSRRSSNRRSRRASSLAARRSRPARGCSARRPSSRRAATGAAAPDRHRRAAAIASPSPTASRGAGDEAAARPAGRSPRSCVNDLRFEDAPVRPREPVQRCSRAQPRTRRTSRTGSAIGANILVITKARGHRRRDDGRGARPSRRTPASRCWRSATPAAPTTRASSRTRPPTTS